MAKVNYLNHFHHFFLLNHLRKLKKTVVKMIRVNRLQRYPLIFLLNVLIKLKLSLLFQSQSLRYHIRILAPHLWLENLPLLPVNPIDFLLLLFRKYHLKTDMTAPLEKQTFFVPVQVLRLAIALQVHFCNFATCLLNLIFYLLKRSLTLQFVEKFSGNGWGAD